eukprot:1444669-Pyramimonas_sp.AAC.1
MDVKGNSVYVKGNVLVPGCSFSTMGTSTIMFASVDVKGNSVDVKGLRMGPETGAQGRDESTLLTTNPPS